MTETLSVAETAVLVHGYTMADVDKIARRTAHRFHNFLDYSDRHDAAWHSVIELLYTSITPPTWHELNNAAARGVHDEASGHLHHHGYSYEHRAEMGAFVAYWGARKTPGSNDQFSDHLLDVMALPQVLSVLSERQKELLVAVASCGSLKLAAQHLGLHQSTVSEQLSRARELVQAAWYAPEHPPIKRFGDPDYCRHGHSRAAHGFVNGGKNYCRLCENSGARRRRWRNIEATREKEAAVARARRAQDSGTA